MLRSKTKGSKNNLKIIQILLQSFKENIKSQIQFIKQFNINMSYKPLAQLVEEADCVIQVLEKEYLHSQAEIKHITQLSKLLSKHFSIFSNELQDVTNKSLNDQKINKATHLKSSLRQLKDILNGVVEHLAQISKDITEIVTIPLDLFSPCFTSNFDNIKSQALDFKQEVQKTSKDMQKNINATNFLGYNGFLMVKKRSHRFDLSQQQKNYSELMKEFQSLQSNKYKILNSAYQHLSTTLNQITPRLEQSNKIGNVQSSSQFSQNPPSLSICKKFIEKIKERCSSLKLLRLVPESEEQNTSPSELIQSKILKQVQCMLGNSQFSDPNTKSLILQDVNNIQLFLDVLNLQVQSQLILSPIKYYQLSTMMKNILRLVLTYQQIRHDILHSILLISLRIHCKERTLIRQLAKDQEYWLKEKSWSDMLEFFKKEISISKNIHKQLSSPIKSDSSRSSKGILNISKNIKKLWNSNSSPQSAEKEQSEITSLEALKQINNFIIKLELPNQFAIKSTVGLCKKQKILQNQLQSLLRAQKVDKKQNLNKKYLSSLNTKLRRQKKFLNPSFNILLHGIKYVIPYLSISDLFQLIIIDKSFYRNLSQPIYRQILIHQPQKIVSKYRTNLYKLILGSKKYSTEFYKSLVQQLPKQLQISQIISQDVKRCMKWAPHLQPQLYEILITYSYNHPEVRYIQGMHCLCERLFHIASHPAQIYSMFQSLICNFFIDILKLNFEKLRLRMYQFTRVLQLYYPKVSQHFFKEKLEAEHYLIQWILTLWGDKQGEIVNILWDGFIISGWKWWIKVCVFLIGLFEKQLLLLNFDSILSHINNQIQQNLLNKKVFDLSEEIQSPETLRSQIDRIKVTDSLMKQIQLQFDYSDYKLNPFLLEVSNKLNG